LESTTRFATATARSANRRTARAMMMKTSFGLVGQGFVLLGDVQ